MTDAKCPPDGLSDEAAAHSKLWRQALNTAYQARGEASPPPIPEPMQVLPDDLPEPIAAMVDQVVARGTLWKVLHAPTLACPPDGSYRRMLILYGPPADLCAPLLSAIDAFPECGVLFTPPTDWTVPERFRSICSPLETGLPRLATICRDLADGMDHRGADEYHECQHAMEALRFIAHYFDGEPLADLETQLLAIRERAKGKHS